MGDTLSGVIWRGLGRLAVGRCGKMSRERHCVMGYGLDWSGEASTGMARCVASRGVPGFDG